MLTYIIYAFFLRGYFWHVQVLSLKEHLQLTWLVLVSWADHDGPAWARVRLRQL